MNESTNPNFVCLQRVAVHSMLNVVEMDGMVQLHVALDQHVNTAILIIHNVYHLDNHLPRLVLPHHLPILVAAQVVQQQHLETAIRKQVQQRVIGIVVNRVVHGQARHLLQVQ